MKRKLLSIIKLMADNLTTLMGSPRYSPDSVYFLAVFVPAICHPTQQDCPCNVQTKQIDLGYLV
jgi:hypothetical protein